MLLAAGRPGCGKGKWIRTNFKCPRLSPARLLLTASCFIALQLDACECSPNRTMPSNAISQAVDFLTKYGYLPQSDLQTGNLRTESQLKEAIKLMQRFGNIPQTGVIDNMTLKLMKRKRCGVPDLIGTSERVKRYALQGQKWPKTNLTWSIKQWAPNVDPNMIRQQFSKAFKVWSDASSLTFQQTRDINADIVISFLRGSHGDGYPFDGRGSVLAHAFFPGEGIGGDAHFDAEELWMSTLPESDSEGVNLFAVAAHEFGHSLGLSHSSITGSLMFPYYQGINDNFQLPYDDTVGIQQLYGPRIERKWAPLPPVKTTTTTTTTTTKSPQRIPTERTRPRPKPTEEPKGRRPRPTHKPTPKVPDTCNTTFDAISVIRREVFAFKNRYFWRMDDKGLHKDYPVAIDRFWYNLPPELQHVDAVYERSIDTKIMFFSGNKYWLFNANTPEEGYPRPVTDLGLPPDLKKIDAAMVWGHNGKTYFFSGKKYWRYEEFEGRVDSDYPRDMAVWAGIPYNIDAAFQWTDGKTYFFKGKYFWKFNDLKMHVEDIKPTEISTFWFGCPSSNEKLPDYDLIYVGIASMLRESKWCIILFLLIKVFSDALNNL
ncbi:matrix metalloproteinase-2-like [Centruroides vittatus]|uniref:matrix metalloproteinase-2-like n=1 Tax=Centruroides vittatus TaxID=120091 RepID=UPI00350F1442